MLTANASTSLLSDRHLPPWLLPGAGSGSAHSRTSAPNRPASWKE